MPEWNPLTILKLHDKGKLVHVTYLQLLRAFNSVSCCKLRQLNRILGTLVRLRNTQRI